MAITLKRTFGSGGADETPEGRGKPSLLRRILAALAGSVGAVPAWQTGIAVTTHVATLSTPGLVLAVEATTATSAGAKLMQVSAAPAAGSVQVAYNGSGVATLTFNATDAVTVCAVQKLGYTEAISVE
jgi:hypothetical protein